MSRAKRIALKKMMQGDPRDMVRLYEAQLAILKQEFEKSKCKGCARGFYERKMKKYEDAISNIKNEKRFRTINFNETPQNN